jgi:hypothetical protein
VFNKLKPVHVDGFLYVCIALFGSVQGGLTDDAYKYLNPYTIFWIKYVATVLLACAGALKMFRSTTYSDHLNNGDVHTPPPKTPPTDPPKP